MRENIKLAPKFENSSESTSTRSMTASTSLHSEQSFQDPSVIKGGKDRVIEKDIEARTQQSSNLTSPESKVIAAPAMLPN